MAVKGAKNKKATQIQEQEVLNTVKGMTFDTVTKELAGVQVELQKTLAELSGKLAEEFQLLETVQESIRLRHEELKQYHAIEVTATTLDDLQAQIQETRENWAEEQEDWKRKFAEMQSDERKQWARQQEDHKYTIEQKQRKQQDALTELFAQQEKQNREKQELLDKQWAEREAILKKAEQELADLRLFKEQAPDDKKKAEAAAVAVATNSLSKEYKHKEEMFRKDAEVEKRLADSVIAKQQEQIDGLKQQIEGLKHQIDQAHQRVADISSKALDSASGRATTEALQRMMETEKMSGKGTK